ncbi:MAG: ferrous iron transport protein B, partial [Syntrophomonadaceae bacterium]|nr:ferrous iron transport protein B [Syntrophomonadaceae bacterium]
MNNIAVIGNPNVGKSAVLNRLTGSQLIVSNYPGTSLEISRASLKIGQHELSIYDTPGRYSLCSGSAEDQAEIGFLTGGEIDLILNIVDASNLERNLVLTLELLESRKPVLVLLNQVDRARNLGINIDNRNLAQLLGAPVLPFSASTGEGLEELLEYIHQKVAHQTQLAPEAAVVATRGEMIRQGSPHMNNLDQQMVCSGICDRCSKSREDCLLSAEIVRAEEAARIARAVTSPMDIRFKEKVAKIQAVIDHPVWGTIAILLMAYLAFQMLLGFIKISEGPLNLVLDPVNHWLEALIEGILPPGMMTDILAKAVPEGLIIPFTIIMPAMLMVSLIMALLEDTGLLPRYSVALERVGSLFGVSGQAVIPLALGFGCRTPAIVATRVLPSSAQRFLIVTLLSIVIPCSATLGILASVIAAFDASLPIIGLTMLVILLLLASVLSRSMPRDSEFIYELPPLRIPLGSNLRSKMKIRFAGFFTEILPLLLLMSIGIRTLMESGLLEAFGGMETFSRLFFGIPAEAFVAVLIMSLLPISVFGNTLASKIAYTIYTALPIVISV